MRTVQEKKSKVSDKTLIPYNLSAGPKTAEELQIVHVQHHHSPCRKELASATPPKRPSFPKLGRVGSFHTASLPQHGRRSKGLLRALPQARDLFEWAIAIAVVAVAARWNLRCLTNIDEEEENKD